MSTFQYSGSGPRPDNPALRHLSPKEFSRPLSSNNPFRNRAESPLLSVGTSPALSSSAAPPRPATARPVSKNPFLSAQEQDQEGDLLSLGDTSTSFFVTSPAVAAPSPAVSHLNTGWPIQYPQQQSSSLSPFGPFSPIQRPASSSPIDRPNSYTNFSETQDMLGNLSISSNGQKDTNPFSSFEDPTSKQQNFNRPPSQMISQDRRRPSANPHPLSQRHENSGLAPPSARGNRPMGSSLRRRNSESSVADSSYQYKSRSTRQPGSRQPKPRVKPKGYDTIDSLDDTGLYGSTLFHHGGPFDACNPRNKRGKSSRPAPVDAFSLSSVNNSLTGSDPNAFKNDSVFGHTSDGMQIFNNEKKILPQEIDPTARTEPIHGIQSQGLGTSTFLAGTPASSSAIQQHERREMQKKINKANEEPGLTRKMSLAQRFRGMSQSRGTRPDLYEGGGMTPPVPMSSTNPASPHMNSRSPVFDSEAAAFNRAAKSYQENRSLDSENDGYGSQGGSTPKESGPSGFLSRVKSLKGGRRKV